MRVKDLANEMYATTISRADTRSAIPQEGSGHLALVSKVTGHFLFSYEMIVFQRNIGF